METIDKTTIKPDEVWIIRSKYAYGDQIAVRDFTATWLAEGAVNWRMIGTRETIADKHIELVRKLVPEPTGWETLRAAADVFAARGIWSWEGWLRDHADRLEAEHDATQARAAADAAREALIEKAALLIFAENDNIPSLPDGWGLLTPLEQDAFKRQAIRLADAGLLVDPEAEAQG